MRTLMSRTTAALEKTHRWMLVVGGAVVAIGAQFVIANCAKWIFGPPHIPPDIFEHRSIAAKLIVGVLLAPFYETLLAQWAIMKFVHGLLRQPWWIAGMTSSILFAMAHGYTDRWFFNLLAGGAVFATVFAIEARRRGRPVFTTFATHAAHNGLVMTGFALWP
jgi:hypothetical protein